MVFTILSDWLKPDAVSRVLGSDRQASVSREISKFYETKHGSLSELAEHFSLHPPQGEIVLVVAGNETNYSVSPPTICSEG